MGASAVAAALFTVGFGLRRLAPDPVSAGAAALGFGLGIGIAAILSASATYGSYGIAVGAGAGAFLLPQMIAGKKSHAGATVVLPGMLLPALVGAGAMILAQLPWYALLVLALAPAAARLPVPQKSPVWLQASLQALYAFIIAAAGCALAWPAAGSAPT